MSFAARQNIQEAEKAAKGRKQEEGRRVQSARQARLAAEMIQRDRDAVHERNHQMFMKLAGVEKIQDSELISRQQNNLFMEIPDYTEHLPAGVTLKRTTEDPLTMLPPMLPLLEEREERKRAERANADVMDENKMNKIR